MDYTKYKGTWWLASDTSNLEHLASPAERVPGTMIFSPQQGMISLHLLGSFNKVSGSSYSLVMGYVGGSKKDKKCVSMFCKMNKTFYRSDGSSIQQLVSLTAFVSDTQFIDSSSTFSKVEVQYTYLLEWVSLKGFAGLAEGREGYHVLIPNYALPAEDLQAVTEDGCQVSVAFKPKSTDNDNTGAFPYSVYLTLNSNTGLTWDVWQSNYIRPLCDLITLATNKPNSVTEAFAYSATGASVRVLFTQKNYEPQQLNVQKSDLLFPLLDSYVLREFGNQGRTFKMSVESWLRISKEGKFAVSRAFLFEVLYSRDMAIEPKFLLLAAAGESYHSAKYNKDQAYQKELVKEDADFLADIDRSDISNSAKSKLESKLVRLREKEPEENISLIAEINKSRTISQSHKGRLIGLVNEPRNESLSRRIHRLADDSTASVGRLLAPYKSSLGPRVSQLRNSLLHGTKIKKDDWRESYCLADVLSFILRTLLLQEMGLSPELCRELLASNGWYNTAVNNAQNLCNQAKDGSSNKASKSRKQKAKPSRDKEVSSLEY